MTEIYVYEDSNGVSVFGGASSVNVNTGFGETGQRGSIIHLFSTDPRTISQSLLPDNLLPNDLAIVPTNNSGNFDMYQKIGTAKQQWINIVKSRTNAFKRNVVFDSNGLASTSFPINTLVSNTTGITVANFIANIELEDTASTPSNNPIAHSIDLNIVGSNLVISIKAAKFNGTAWSSVVSETRLAHINISVV